MIKCSKCKQDYNKDQFYKKTGTRLQSYCKSCLLTVQKDRWHERKRKYVSLLGGRCSDCKNSFPTPVYQFHHLNPEEKDYSWNKLRQMKEETIIKELSKCVLLCANCHMLRHSKYD